MSFKEDQTVNLKDDKQADNKRNIIALKNSNGDAVYDGDSFEIIRSINQELTFEATKKEFDLRKVPFGPSQMKTLKLVSPDGLYTNLGLLLSEQCPYTTNCVIFQGTTPEIFKKRQEFSSSLITQLNEVYNFIDFYNQTRSTFEKLLRIDTRDYSEVAIREALINTIVHRDYSFNAGSIINIYSDRIEFISLGGLLPGLELDDIVLGVSACRNPNLANVFYRLELIEAYGTGMQKIMEAYVGAPLQPTLKVTNNAFKITLPNMNAMREVTEKPQAIRETVVLFGSSNEEKIMHHLAEKQVITRKETQELLGVSQSTAGRILKSMVDKGQIVQIGGSRNIRYEITKSKES